MRDYIDILREIHEQNQPQPEYPEEELEPPFIEPWEFLIEEYDPEAEEF